MKKLKFVIVAMLITSIFIIGCGKNKENEKELGEIKPPVETKAKKEKLSDELLFKTPDGKMPNIYKQNGFQSTVTGEEIELDKIKDDDIVVGKAYFLSEEDAYNFVEKEIKYVKGDLTGMINTYHQLLCKDNFSTLGVRLESDGSLLLNFTGFSPTSYVLDNQSFKKIYLDNSPGVRDVSFVDGAQEAVLKGYYKTIKANFPEVKYIYFQLGGVPWEVINGEVHDGLLFMEPGQTRPEKAPEFLTAYIDEDKYDEETGFSNDYTGDRNLENETKIVPLTRDFSNIDNTIVPNDKVTDENEDENPDEQKYTEFGAPADEEGHDIFESEEKTQDYIDNLEEVEPNVIIDEYGNEIVDEEEPVYHDEIEDDNEDYYEDDN